jgi:PIN domain nuclease of toxin-antitoxin system
VILDTQAFLWFVSDLAGLSKKARSALKEPENEIFLSLASTWEIAIKLSLGKLKIAEPLERFIPQQLLANSIRQLDISFRHVARVATLPFHHRDPFDRLLVSQAMLEDMPILSADKAFDSYGVKRIW